MIPQGWSTKNEAVRVRETWAVVAFQLCRARPPTPTLGHGMVTVSHVQSARQVPTFINQLLASTRFALWREFLASQSGTFLPVPAPKGWHALGPRYAWGHRVFSHQPASSALKATQSSLVICNDTSQERPSPPAKCRSGGALRAISGRGLSRWHSERFGHPLLLVVGGCSTKRRRANGKP